MNKLREKNFNRDDMAEYLKTAVPYPALKQAVIFNVEMGMAQCEIVISAHSTFAYHLIENGYQIDVHNAGLDRIYTLEYDGLDRSEADLSVFRFIRDSLQFLSENKASIDDFLNSIYGENP